MHDRLYFLSYILFGLVPLASTAATPNSDHPNVILILADDLGPGILGHNGQKIITTPNIDKLAAEGMRMTNHYGNTYCAPSRWSLMTGMHNGRTRSGSEAPGGKVISTDKNTTSPADWNNVFNLVTDNVRPIPKNERFLAQFAQQAGYSTAQFGKLDIGFLTWNERLKRRGWDYHFGYYDHVRAHGFYPTYLWRNGTKIPLAGNTNINAGKMGEHGTEPVGSGGTTYSQDVFDEEILKYIRDHRSEQFFLYHPTQLPHGPVAVQEIHPNFITRDDLTLSEKKYATMVKSLDNTVGKIMNELKILGLDENTIVFFSSDNGHETYYQNSKKQLPKDLWRSGKLADGSKANLTDKKWRGSNGGDTFNGNLDKAGLKWSAWQGGVLCPAIVRWPGKIKAGSSSPLLTTLYDFMPTLAEIVGSKAPINKDGISYLQTLLGKQQKQKHDWVFINSTGPRTRSTLITQNGYKLIQLKDKTFQLYNVLTDPKEYHNIANQHPTLIKNLIPIFNQQLNSKRPDLEPIRILK